MSLEAQYLTMVTMSISGALMGALYDMYQVLLKEWKFLRRFGAIFDFLYWIIASALVFSMLLFANYGDLRFYIFVILLLGYGIYRLLFQKIMCNGPSIFS